MEQRSNETASRGHAAVTTEARESLQALKQRFPKEPHDRQITVAHRPGETLLLDDYLRTRLVELAIHTEDLALSLGISHAAPGETVSEAVGLLLEAARERHGDLAVLHALARRERDTTEALRVL